MGKVFNLILIVILASTSLLNAQPKNDVKFNMMQNCISLGLEEKGLEYCAELISDDEYKSKREETIFFIANYFLNKAYQQEDSKSIESIIRAYNFYTTLLSDYPNSQHIEFVKKRMADIESWRTLIQQLYKWDANFELENGNVRQKLSFINSLVKINAPDALSYFLSDGLKGSALETLDRCLDEIIVNNPTQEIFAYYYKIMARIGRYTSNIISPGILKLTDETYPLEWNQGTVVSGAQIKVDGKLVALENPKDKNPKEQLFEYLKILDKKYPSHFLTLNLHLIIAKIEMKNNSCSNLAKNLLEFITQNDQDKTGLRYFIAREYLLQNKFIN